MYNWVVSRRSLIVLIGGFLAALVLYWPALSAQFVYDDAWYVVQNPAIRQITPLRFFLDPSTAAAPESGLAGDVYRPVTTLSFALSFHLWKLNPVPYHVLNILLHALNTWLVWMLLRLLLANNAAALLGALVFLMHPVQVETVAWVSQRSNLLSTTFLLSGMLFWMIKSRRIGVSRLVGAGFLFLAMLCRESAIVAVALVPLSEWVHRGPARKISEGSWGLKWVPLGIAAILYLALRVSRLHHWSQWETVSQAVGAPWALGLLAFPRYLGKTLLPMALRVSYDYPLFSRGMIALSGALAVVYITFAFFQRKRRPLITLAMAWFLLALLPVLQILPIRAFVAERFLYLAIVGISITVGWAVAVGPRWIRAALGIWAVFLTASTLRAVPHWSSDETLWYEAVRQEPSNAFAQCNYAEVAADASEAEAHYRLALTNRPTEEIRFASLNNLAALTLKEHHYADALGWAQQAAALRPDDARAAYELCLALIGVGRKKEAQLIFVKLQKYSGIPNGVLQRLKEQLGS
jgi:protein O-mannosyl-transferase